MSNNKSIETLRNKGWCGNVKRQKDTTAERIRDCTVGRIGSTGSLTA